MQKQALTRVLSKEEYLINEAQSSLKSEYLHGELVAMAGAQPAHNLIIAKLIALLVNGLSDKDCLVYSSDQLIYAPDCDAFFYADISIVCETPDYLRSPGGLAALKNPSFIIEVLSDSTKHYDRTEKFVCYRSIESLIQYIMVSPDEVLIESYTKVDSEHWLLTIAKDKSIKIGDCELQLGEIYRKVLLG